MHPIVHTTKPDPNTLPGFWEPKVIPDLQPAIKLKHIAGIRADEAFVLENVLSEKDCETLIAFMNASDNFEKVGVQGMKDKKDHRVGSLRTSIWTPGVAELIWNKIGPFMTDVDGHRNRLTDWWQDVPQEAIDKNTVNYHPVAVSPLLRFMKYSNGGQHYAHYDAAYMYPDNKFRTLKSMVVYLTTNESAATRFINDRQTGPIWDREHNDWNRPVLPHEVIGRSECVAGNVLVFDHRMCHDVEQYFGADQRVIIRGDIVYEQEDLYL